MRDVFIEVLTEEVEKNSQIILITGDLGFGVLDNFKEKYPNNFINAGVAEQNMTGIAAGMALEGKIIFTYSIANFPTLRCLEQIRNDVCYHNLKVNIVAIGGGFSYGALGMSHHATEDIAIMRSLPNLRVISPSTLGEVKKVTKAIIEKPEPTYLRLDKSFGLENNKSSLENFSFGRIYSIKKKTDCTIFVTGGILEEVQNAVIKLNKKKIKVQVINVHSIKPIDKRGVSHAIKLTRAVITVEEHSVIGGLGSTIADIIVDSQFSSKLFLKIGLDDRFSSVVGSQKYLRKIYGMDSDSIFKKIINLVD